MDHHAERSLSASVRGRQLAQSGDGRSVRQAAGASLRELADACGVSAATLSRWERAKNRPRGRSAARYEAEIVRLVVVLAESGGLS